MADSLIDKIEDFSPEERKLLLLKLKDLVNKVGDPFPGENRKRLVAFVQHHPEFEMESFQSYLKDRLPAYMIPTAIHTLVEIPKLPNGKIDKNALKKLRNRDQEEPGNSPRPASKTEKQLIAIWEEVLQVSPIFTNDNFFEIGGDSMLSIKMFWLIEKKLHVKLPPTTLLSNPTIAGIARQIHNFHQPEEKKWEYLVPIRTHGNKLPLFCIHGGEGHVLFYKSIPDYIDSDRPVYFIQPKGIDGTGPMHNSIEEMSRDYISEILQIQGNGPYNLLFYCCSALVVEMTKQLQSMQKIANNIVVDSSPRNLPNTVQWTQKERFSHYMRKLIKYPVKTLNASLKYRYYRHLEPYYLKLRNDKVAQRLRRIRRQLQKVRYQYHWEKFDASITLILAKNEHSDIMKKDIALWNHWCKSGVGILMNPGNHFSLFDEPNVKTLGKNVEKACR